MRPPGRGRRGKRLKRKSVDQGSLLFRLPRAALFIIDKRREKIRRRLDKLGLIWYNNAQVIMGNING